MIKSFRHKGLEVYFLTGNKAGIQSQHAKRLRIQLTALHAATNAGDMDAPGWRLHKLRGHGPKGQPIQDHYAITVSGNWRLTFYFDGENAVLVDYQDYH